MFIHEITFVYISATVNSKKTLLDITVLYRYFGINNRNV